jgi:hypothetical protein
MRRRFTPRTHKINYMPCISHHMQKHKFGVMCPGVLFVDPALVPPKPENNAPTFHTTKAQEHTTRPADPTGYKNTSSAYCVLTTILWNPSQSHMTMKNNASVIHVVEAPECTTLRAEPTEYKKTKV